MNKLYGKLERATRSLIYFTTRSWEVTNITLGLQFSLSLRTPLYYGRFVWSQKCQKSYIHYLYNTDTLCKGDTWFCPFGFHIKEVWQYYFKTFIGSLCGSFNLFFLCSHQWRSSTVRYVNHAQSLDSLCRRVTLSLRKIQPSVLVPLNPFKPQDLHTDSPHWSPYMSFKNSRENLVED